MKVGLLLGAFLAFIGTIVCLPFIPVVQIFTNSSNERMSTALNVSGFAETPFAPLIHLANVWVFAFIIFLGILVFWVMSRRQV